VANLDKYPKCGKVIEKLAETSDKFRDQLVEANRR